MPRSPRIVIVGAGIIGASLALQLAAHGAAVTVLETAAPGAGTTGTSFAWVNASSKHAYRDAYFNLNHAALREHRAYAKEASPPWFFPTGDIEIATDAAEAITLEAKVANLAGRGYAARLITSSELDTLEPGIVLPRHGAAAFYADEAWIHTPDMIADVVRRATDAGADFIVGPAAGPAIASGAVTGVRLADGAVLKADIVVTALGRWTTPFLAGIGVHVPLASPDEAGSPAVGLLVTVKDAMPRRLLHSRDVNWSPRPLGRTMLASNAADATLAADRSAATMRAAALDLLAYAAALNPAMRGCEIEDARIGLRALPADNMSVCGWAEPVGGLYTIATHSGVTLAPLLARCAAAEIMGAAADPLLATFRPRRFSRANAA